MSIIADIEKRFADKFGAKYCIMMNSGTATLHAALVAVGVKPGDIVASPALTVFMDTAATIHAGGVPHYIDIDPYTWNISKERLSGAIKNNNIKAVIGVGLYGLEISKEIAYKAWEKGVPFIEDNAQAFNMSFSGGIASYSFESSKHISCGEGGCLITNCQEYAQKARMFANHGYGFNTAEGGRTKLTNEELSDPNFKRHYMVGYNYRMPEPCAEILKDQIDNIESIVKRRQDCAMYYIDAIGIDPLFQLQGISGLKHSHWTFAVALNDGFKPDRFIKAFRENGGDTVRAAWSIPYREPATNPLANLCMSAEQLQPRIMQFKTNYKNPLDAKRQAQILKKTAAMFI